MFADERSKASRYLIYAGFFFIVIIGLKFTAYFVSIFVISLMITLLALPAMEWLSRKGLPDILSVSILAGIAVLAVLAFAGITVYSLGAFLQGLPDYGEELTALAAELPGITAILGNFGVPVDLLSLTPGFAPEGWSLLSSLLKISDLLMFLFFIGVTTFFMLLEAPRFLERLRHLPWVGPEKVTRFSRLSRYMIDFIIVRTETNLVHGILFGGILYAMGIQGALLWGLLTFVLSYIPYIGLIIAAIPAVFFAWLQFGIWGVVAVIAVVCILNLVVENPVFSYFASRTFQIPPLVVILSVIFWGWLLGFAGLVFAVPLTLLVLILLRCSDDLAWIPPLVGAGHIFGDEDEDP